MPATGWRGSSCRRRYLRGRGLCLALAAHGEWGRPATASKERLAELTALRDRAGKNGDRKAFEELSAAAARNQIDASTKSGRSTIP